MNVYSCMGWAFDDANNGIAYYRTKAEALAAARHATAPDVREGYPQWSNCATVSLHRIAAPITHERIVALLNAEGWCEHTEEIAKVVNGHVVRTRT